jgi:hypothetical protein
VYGNRGEGDFAQLRNGMWIEVNDTGTFRYHEVGRTRDFVELYDADRNVCVRLYDRRLLSRGGDQDRWSPGYVGHWE